MNLRPLEPHSSTLPNCATPSQTLRGRLCRRAKRYYSSIFAGECQAAERHAARRKGGEARTTTGGWGRAVKGQAERQAPCAARKGGGVRKTGRRSRAPEKAAQTATRARRQRPTPASSAPTPTSSSPRPPTMFPLPESRADSAQRSQ